MPYFLLIAQIGKPKQLRLGSAHNCITTLCFLCTANGRNGYFIMSYQARLLSYLYSNTTSLSLKSAATYYQVCLFFPSDVTNRIKQQSGMCLAAVQAQAVNRYDALLWMRSAVQQELLLLFLITLVLIWNNVDLQSPQRHLYVILGHPNALTLTGLHDHVVCHSHKHLQIVTLRKSGGFMCKIVIILITEC